MPDIERRTFALERLAVRSRGDVLGFKGHAALFNSRTWIGPARFGFWEEIAPGAFGRAVQEDDVRFLFDHDPGKVLARTTAGTLRLREDKQGLAVEADMAPVSYAHDLAVLLERGDLSEMSFAFRVDDDDEEQVRWSRTKEGEDVRRILEVPHLSDVSVVAYPAYSGTDAALRAVEARRADHRSTHLQSLRARLDAAYEGRGPA